jgi:hypothetical protein
MRKLLNNPWVVGGLAVAALAFVAMPLLPKWGSGPSPSPVVDDTTSVEGSADDSVGANAPSNITLALKDLVVGAPRDPFAGRTKVQAQAAVAEVAAVPDSVDTLRLSAIWVQGADTFVLINGAIRQAGDEFSRFKIESAARDGVWVTHWKGRDFLSLGTEFTLVTPSARSEARVSL